MLAPQQISVFHIKYIVPGLNETNNATSLANSNVKLNPLNFTKPAADLDGDSKIATKKGISHAVKVSTAEKDVKKEEPKEEKKAKSFPKPEEPKREEIKKEEPKLPI